MTKNQSPTLPRGLSAGGKKKAATSLQGREGRPPRFRPQKSPEETEGAERGGESRKRTRKGEPSMSIKGRWKTSPLRTEYNGGGNAPEEGESDRWEGKAVD